MRHTIVTLLLLLGMTALAQSPAAFVLTGDEQGRDMVSVQNFQVVTAADKTVLTLDFVLDDLRVPGNRYRAFTPVIRSADGSRQQRMKSLLVTGRTQAIVFEREGIDPLYAGNCDALRRQNGQPQTYAYTDAVTTEPWHQQAEVLIECDLCGCGDTLRSQLVPVGTILPPPVSEAINPLDYVCLCDTTPEPGKQTRRLHGSAYITFVVDKTDLNPLYMNNPRELRKITDTLDVMVADPNITVKEIKIHGWASPESPYAHNTELATGRAQTLTNYVMSLYQLPRSVFAPAEATPENWIGLREAVEQLDADVLPHRTEILATIDKVLADIGRGITTQADRDELSLKSRYPQEYDYLKSVVYPGLRRSDYDISFNIREFSLQEAVEIYRTKPYQLSLRELWDVAQTFEPYSEEYNRAMQVAVNVFPDSTVALINLANVALRKGDQLKAETLLRQAGESGFAENARGVLCILQGRYDEAERHFLRAEQQGIDVSCNRKAIRRLTE